MNIKNILIQNKKILVLSSIFIVMVLTIINNMITIEKAKKEVLKAKNSDDIILINNIKVSKEKSKSLTVEIEKKKQQLKISNLNTLCNQEQLNRRIDWLEYSLSYCKDEENLKKFDTGLQ